MAWRTGARERSSSAPRVADLAAIEARLWSLLAPYRTRGLVDSTIYGMPSLAWPGAKAHDYFAAVKPASKHVSLFAIAVDTFPEVLAGAPPELLRRRTGKATFNFPTLDDALAGDLAALLERLFERYEAAHRG
jgi:hypothetical protein